MTWVLTKVTRTPVTDPRAIRRAMEVRMEFANQGGNGVSTETHIYVEPFVTEVSEEGIARLVADQMRQLEKISSTPAGDIADLSTIKAIVNERLAPPPEPTPPTKEELAAQKETQDLQAKLSRIQVMKQMKDQGLLSDERIAELEQLCAEVKAVNVEKLLPQLAVADAVADPKLIG